MSDFVKLTSTFVNSVALVMALVLLISLLQRAGRAPWASKTIMGGIFSLAVVFTMSDPIQLPSSVMYDMRTLLIGAAVALLGPMVGFITLVTAMIYRWEIGGAAVSAGMTAIALSYTGGLIWRLTIHKRPWRIWLRTLLLGIMISANVFAILLLPQAVWMKLVFGLVPYIFISHIIGSFLLYYLISGELSFHSEAETLRVHASTDHLTGLLNRRGLELIYPELAQENGPPRGRALVCFDIDNFKLINDTNGHATGDSVLKFIADEIGRSLRPKDIFARLGGDEFAIVLSRIDKIEAKRIAERCRTVVEESVFSPDGKALPVTISVGAIWMLDHSEIDQILDEADKALYVAKSKGRNKVVFKTGTAFRPPETLAPAV